MTSLIINNAHYIFIISIFDKIIYELVFSDDDYYKYVFIFGF